MPDSSNPPETKTYVYDGLEVMLTGRSAERKIESKSARRPSTPRVDTIHEICPADKESGSWKKWVRMTDMYEVA